MFNLGFVDILLIIVSIALIILVALQSSNDDIGSALSGAKNDENKNRKVRGIEAHIVRATYTFSVAFIVLAAITLIR